nr:hypothetical protein Itr_chr03CG18900 [Ipomoea trifida]
MVNTHSYCCVAIKHTYITYMFQATRRRLKIHTKHSYCCVASIYTTGFQLYIPENYKERKIKVLFNHLSKVLFNHHNHLHNRHHHSRRRRHNHRLRGAFPHL